MLQALRTVRTKAQPRGGFAGVSPVDLLVSLQREPARGPTAGLGVAVLAERIAP